MLPYHRIDDIVGTLHARRKPRQFSRRDNNTPLVQHRREDDDHVVRVDGVVVFRKVALENKSNKTNVSKVNFVYK